MNGVELVNSKINGEVGEGLPTMGTSMMVRDNNDVQPCTAEVVPSRRRHWIWTISVVAALAIASFTTWKVIDSRGQADFDAAQRGFESSVSELSAAITPATETLAASDEKLSEQDAPLRVALSDVVDRATTATAPLDVSGLDRGAATAAYVSSTSTVRELTSELTGATSAVTAAVGRWELAQAQGQVDTATASLDQVIAAATATFTDSDGKVDDNAVRATLSATIDHATAVRGQTVGTTASELTARAAALNAERGAVATAQQAVIDAQATWQNAQDAATAAAHAEQAQNSKSSSTSSGSAKSGSSKSSGSSNSGSGSSQSGGSSDSSGGSNGSGGGNGGTTIVEEGGFGSKLCFDSVGNTYPC